MSVEPVDPVVSYAAGHVAFYDALGHLIEEVSGYYETVPNTVLVSRLRDLRRLANNDFSTIGQGGVLHYLLLSAESDHPLAAASVLKVLEVVADGRPVVINHGAAGPGEELQVSTMTENRPTTNPIAADERCDRCNAAGKLRVTLAGGSQLVFCGHHANKYAEELVKVTVEYVADPQFSWRGAELMADPAG